MVQPVFRGSPDLGTSPRGIRKHLPPLLYAVAIGLPGGALATFFVVLLKVVPVQSATGLCAVWLLITAGIMAFVWYSAAQRPETATRVLPQPGRPGGLKWVLLEIMGLITIAAGCYALIQGIRTPGHDFFEDASIGFFAPLVALLFAIMGGSIAGIAAIPVRRFVRYPRLAELALVMVVGFACAVWFLYLLPPAPKG
jgi:hypothetical protein